MAEGTTPRRRSRKKEITPADLGFEACALCRFFVPTEGEGGEMGECHKDPPRFLVFEDCFCGVFPPVCSGNWCGAFEAKG